MPDTAVRDLLAGSIDYAGLFPPAALDMPAAAKAYAEYLAGPDAWALGRFVVPAARLDELESEAEPLAPRRPAAPWRLSALLGAQLKEDLARIGEHNCRHAAESAASLTVDAVEAKADSPAAIDRLVAALPPWLPPGETYVELPLEPDPAPLVAALARHGARAKVRTGGVTAEAFPDTAQLLRFLRACAEAGVAFKATAGLHHLLRAEYRLTYAADSGRGTMFGYINVFLAAAFLRQGMGDADAARLLEERSADAFQIGPEVIGWRGHRLDRAAIAAVRSASVTSFGSCSFTEPVGELRGMRWA